MKKRLLLFGFACLIGVALLILSSQNAKATWKETSSMRRINVLVMEQGDDGEVGEAHPAVMMCCRETPSSMCQLDDQNEACPPENAH